MNAEGGNWSTMLETAELTDVGQRRSNNQDSYRIVLAASQEEWRQRGHVLVVADGMGAHAAGELASKLAVDKLPHLYRKYQELSPPEALQRALVDANSEIHRRGQANMDFHNMGTTASSLVLLPQGALVGHVGDSRVYRVHGQEIEQLTFDHSLVWELEASGQLPSGPAQAAIPRNVITRSLGPSAQVMVDIEGPVPLQSGDVFLLCSDGLSGQLDDEEIGALAAHLPPGQAVQLAVDLANLRGGPDNITVLIARVVEDVKSDATLPPLSVGVTHRPIEPLAWVICGVALLFALVFFLASQKVISGLLAFGGLAVLVYDALRAVSQARRGVLLGGKRRLGNGPYRRWKLPSQEQFAERLRRSAEEIQQFGQAEGWDVDWERLENTRKTSLSKPPLEAAKMMADALNRLFIDYREWLNRKSSDSAVDL